MLLLQSCKAFAAVASLPAAACFEPATTATTTVVCTKCNHNHGTLTAADDAADAVAVAACSAVLSRAQRAHSDKTQHALLTADC